MLTIAEQVVGAMVVAEPVKPLGWAVARDEEGKPLYVVAVVMGSENARKFEGALKLIEPNMAPVDIFPTDKSAP